MDADKELALEDALQALGHIKRTDEGDAFEVGSDPRGGLKDLEQLLRRDNGEQQLLHLRLGELHTMKNQLLPLLQHSPQLDILARKEDPNAPADVGYRCIKVLVRLTLPLASLVEHRLERLRHLQESKAWLLEGDALMTLMHLLASPLSIDASDRTEHQRNMVELGLTLVRNLLAIPDPVSAPHEHARKLHDRCIMRMHQELVLDTLCTLAASIDSSTETPIKFLLQESFAHLFRQEKNVDDLFVGEADALALRQHKELEARSKKEEQERQETKQAQARVAARAAAKRGATAAPSVSQSSSSSSQHRRSVIDSERDRISESLNAVVAAQQAAEYEMSRTGLARHSRFGSKYAVRVVLSSSGQDASHGVEVGPDGEQVRVSLPTQREGTQVFATRFVRNPFGATNQKRMVNDALASQHGRRALGSQNPRSFLSLEVKQALHATACLLLDGGGYNTLLRVMLDELNTGVTRDLVLSDDSLHFMHLAAFFMHFQRTRSKERVRIADKQQRAEEREQAERERAEAERVKKEKAEAAPHSQQLEGRAREGEALHGASRVRAPAPVSAGGEGSSSELIAQSGSPQGGSSLSAPVFPNAVDSQGQLTFDSQQLTQTQSQSQAPASSLMQLDDGIDETLEANVAAAAASSAVPATAAVPVDAAPVESKPFIRRVCFDATPIRASLTHDCWKYLTSRVKQYMEDKPTPWLHLAASVRMYKELVRCLYEMYFFGDVTTRMRADQLRRSLFYDRDSIELFADLLHSYSPSKAPRTYLEDLVAATHYQMRLLEELAQGEKFTIFEKRRRVVRQKKTGMDLAAAKAAKKAALEAAALAADAMLAAEEGREPGAAAAAAGAGVEDDGPSESAKAILAMQARRKRLAAEEAAAVPMADEGGEQESKSKGDEAEEPAGFFPHLTEEQGGGEGEAEPGSGRPLSALEKAQRALRASKEASALAFSAQQEEDEKAVASEEKGGEEDGEPASDDDEYETVEIEEDHRRTVRRSSEFDFDKFLARFANAPTVAHYVQLLGAYRDLSRNTVHQILVFFQRLSKAGLQGMLFQLSSFVLFERLLTDQWVKSRPEMDELRVFIKGVTRKFLTLITATKEVVQKDGSVARVHPNRHLFLDLLFVKNAAVAEKLLQEDGWFDSSRDRITSARDLGAFSSDEEGEEEGGEGAGHGASWQDVDEEEEEAKARERRAAEEAKLAEEAQLPSTEWADNEAGGKKVRTRPWTSEEDSFLRTEYANFAGMDATLDILHSMMPLRSTNQIKDRLKKLGLGGEKKAVRAAKPAAGGAGTPAAKGKKGKKSTASALVSLAEMMDRHEFYTRVPPIDDVADEMREVVVGMVQADCRSALGAALGELKVCRDTRARLNDTSSPSSQFPPFPSFDFRVAEGEDSRAVDALVMLFKIMGVKDQDGPLGAWTVPSHFTVQDLDDYIGLLEATLDSPAASAAQDADDDEAAANDEAISRAVALDMARAEQQPDNEGEEEEAEATPAAAVSKSLSTEDVEAAQRKAARRAKREAKQLKEAMELSAAASSIVHSSPSASQPEGDTPGSSRRRRRHEDIGERIQRERLAAEERRAREAAEDDAVEAQFEGDSATALGAHAVDEARQKEKSLTSNFKHKELDDYMANKRKRFVEAISASNATSSEKQSEGHSPAKRAKTGAAAAAATTPKSTSAPKHKRLLRRAAAEESEDDETPAPSQALMDDDDADGVAPALAAPEDEAAAAAVIDDEGEDDETPAAVAVAPKKKHAARRRIASDEEEEEDGEGDGDEGAGEAAAPAASQESRAEGQPASSSRSSPTPSPREGDAVPAAMDTDEQPHTSTGTVDTQAETQLEATQAMQV